MTAVAVAAETRLVLRCAHCSHVVGIVGSAMRLIGTFKSSYSFTFRVLREPVGMVRKRCQSCGWVNVFCPADQVSRGDIELKRS